MSNVKVSKEVKAKAKTKAKKSVNPAVPRKKTRKIDWSKILMPGGSIDLVPDPYNLGLN